MVRSGRELAHAGHVEQGAPAPFVGLAEDRVDLVLGGHVAGVVGQQQVVVAVVPRAS